MRKATSVGVKSLRPKGSDSIDLIMTHGGISQRNNFILYQLMPQVMMVGIPGSPWNTDVIHQIPDFLRRLANGTKDYTPVRQLRNEADGPLLGQPDRLTAKAKGEFYLITVLGR